jgi:hypothetical protein
MRVFASLLALLLLGCGSSSSPSAAAAVCGDGLAQGDERCDDGVANATAGHCKKDCSGMPSKVTVSGDLFAFLQETSGARISGATIRVLEQPDRSTATDAQGHFELGDLDEGTEVTLVVEHPTLFPTQTGTVVLPADGVHPFVIQALPVGAFKLLSALLPPVDLDHNCAMATTVSRLGGTLHVNVRQGEAGAIVTSSPALPAEVGPIYFNEAVLPDRNQPATSKDGGVVFANVPPGEYVLSASKDGTAFSPVKMKCRAGFLINAGPPLGLQASVVSPDWGADLSAAPPPQMAALCEQTAACVNQAHADRYPPATVDSCKRTFRRALSFVDAGCDAGTHLVDAWSAYYGCKAASCEAALGDDTVCAPESEAWVDAMAAYAPCYAGKHQQ